ncbi:MAG: alpha/beta fold hydrolase [Solirubrobacterales bacterium]
MESIIYQSDATLRSMSYDFWRMFPDPLKLRDPKVDRFLDLLAQMERPYVAWSTPNNIVYEHQTLRLRHFKSRRSDPESHRPVLILPPQAGHHSVLADYSPSQSLVRVFQSYGYDVYVCEWLSATQKYKNLGIADYIRLTDEAVEVVRERSGFFKIHIVGQCQGGWQATLYTSLFQEKVATLVSAAAPVDAYAAPSAFIDDAQLPMAFFEYMVATGNGLMDGKFILWGFKNLQAEEHYVKKYKRLWKWIEDGDEEAIKRMIRFENWYEYTQKLPGRFYLEIIKNIFKENNFTKPGAMKIDGQPVDFRKITCPVIIMAGKKDHITPPAQAFALKNLVSTPAADIVEILTDGGHIGTLMGTESLREDWTAVNEVLKLAI